MKFSFPIFRPLLLLGIMTSSAAIAQEPERKVPKDPNTGEVTVDPKEKPKVVKIGESRFRMGDIEFDAKTKEIFIPATVNKREGGPVEYLLVQESGKVHESVLTTKASPLHLQIVTKLLKQKSGYGNVFDPMLAEEEQEKSDEKNGDQFTLLARWEADGKAQEQDLSGWIVDGESMKAPADEPWTLTGSNVQSGNFMAEIEGSLIAVYLDPIAIFNMTRKGSEIDERWGANDKVIPPIGHKLTVVLKPAEKK